MPEMIEFYEIHLTMPWSPVIIGALGLSILIGTIRLIVRLLSGFLVG